MNSNFFRCLIINLFLLIIAVSAYPQNAGCPDPLANNYNAAARKNDGSCTYSLTKYNPPLKSRLNSILNESSGLQMAANFLWSFNDGGGATAIYRIDTLSNALLQTVVLANASNVDWEDIGFDGTFFYVGDFGNNLNGARTDLKIYKFAIAEIPDYINNPVVTIPANKIEVINFKYQNQLTPIVTALNNTKFDCEAMIVDNGKIHLFSKNWVDLNTTHYVINSTKAGHYIADSIETLPTNFLVTGADKAPAEAIVALIGYVPTPPGRHFIEILTDYSRGKYFVGNKRKLNLPDALEMGQAEGITFRNNRYGYISNERLSIGPLSIRQKLRSFNITNYVTAIANSDRQ